MLREAAEEVAAVRFADSTQSFNHAITVQVSSTCYVQYIVWDDFAFSSHLFVLSYTVELSRPFDARWPLLVRIIYLAGYYTVYCTTVQ